MKRCYNTNGWYVIHQESTKQNKLTVNPGEGSRNPSGRLRRRVVAAAAGHLTALGTGVHQGLEQIGRLTGETPWCRSI